MGNSIIWKCKYCNFANLNDNDLCSQCSNLKMKDNPSMSIVCPPPQAPTITINNANNSSININNNINNDTTILDQSLCAPTFSNSFTNTNNDLNPLLRLNSFDINKSSLIHLRINQKASQSTSNLQKVYTNQKRNSYLTHFIDNDFPPIKQSLYMNGNNVKRSNLIHSNGFKQIKKWLRPHEVNVTPEENYLPVSLFSDPSPKDVIQGELGTCWFLSALALLAEKPFLLLNCIISQKYNPIGVHQVRLCRRGEWIVVNIDDYLPCDKQNQLVFSYGRKRQFWVPFMEKALAKLYGSYESVARGACAEGLQTLTGEPCEVLYLQMSNSKSEINGVSHQINSHENNPFMIWKKIIVSRKLGYLMTTLCYNENLKFDTFNKVGLLNRHIYSILDAREFENNGMPIQLLRLRNPWGHKEWKGDWSNGWTKWPDHIRSQLSVLLNNDGCFWISFHDVLKYFYDITICKVRADWTESRQSSYFYDYSYGTEVYMITLTQPGLHQFEIELFATGRKSEVFDRNADPNIDLCLVLCKVNDPSSISSGLTCIAFEHSVEYYITLSASLAPGYYMVFATSIKALSSQLNETKYQQQQSEKNLPPFTETSTDHSLNYFSYNIIFHGQSTFGLNRTLLAPDVISDIFYSVALKMNKVKYELNGTVRSFVITGSCTHGIFIENLSPTYCIRIQLDISSSKNLESTRLTQVTQDYLRPNTRQLLAFLTPLNYRNGYVIGYKLDTQIFQYFANGNFPNIPISFAGLHAVKS